jgi:hypothetical protein
MQLGSFNMPAKDERKLAMRRFCLGVLILKDGMDSTMRRQDVQPAVDSSYVFRQSL